MKLLMVTLYTLVTLHGVVVYITTITFRHRFYVIFMKGTDSTPSKHNLRLLLPTSLEPQQHLLMIPTSQFTFLVDTGIEQRMNLNGI